MSIDKITTGCVQRSKKLNDNAKDAFHQKNDSASCAKSAVDASTKLFRSTRVTIMTTRNRLRK